MMEPGLLLARWPRVWTQNRDRSCGREGDAFPSRPSDARSKRWLLTFPRLVLHSVGGGLAMLAARVMDPCVVQPHFMCV